MADKIIEITVRRREARAALAFLTQNGLAFDSFPRRDDTVFYRAEVPAPSFGKIMEGLKENLRTLNLLGVMDAEEPVHDAAPRGFRALSGRSVARPMAFRLFGVKR